MAMATAGALAQIRASARRNNLTLEHAAKLWVYSNPNQAEECADELGSWPSEDPETAALLKALNGRRKL